jgi:hypothetical protein
METNSLMDLDTRGSSPSRDRDRSRRGERTGSRFEDSRDRSREKDRGDCRRIYVSK